MKQFDFGWLRGPASPVNDIHHYGTCTIIEPQLCGIA